MKKTVIIIARYNIEEASIVLIVFSIFEF
jgi:hypothetical protein